MHDPETLPAHVWRGEFVREYVVPGERLERLLPCLDWPMRLRWIDAAPPRTPAGRYGWPNRCCAWRRSLGADAGTVAAVRAEPARCGDMPHAEAACRGRVHNEG